MCLAIFEPVNYYAAVDELLLNNFLSNFQVLDSLELQGLAIKRNGYVYKWMQTSNIPLSLRCKWHDLRPAKVTFTNTMSTEINTSSLNYMLLNFEFKDLKSLRINSDRRRVQTQLLFKKLPSLEKLSIPANDFSRKELARTGLKALVIYKIDHLITEPYDYLNIVTASKELEILMLSFDIYKGEDIQSLVANVLECGPVITTFIVMLHRMIFDYPGAISLADELKAEIVDENSFPTELNELVQTDFERFSHF